MRTKMHEELSAMQREVASRNEDWLKVKEEFAAAVGTQPVPVDIELFLEIDRVCDATVLGRRSTRIQNVAIRG